MTRSLGPLERRLAEAEARQESASNRTPPQFIDESLPEQAAFIRDPARRKLVFSARRGGKSYGEGRFMCQEAWATPNVSCLYVGLTRDSAWRTMWRDVLKDLNRKLHLEATFNETKLLMTFTNGSTIQLLGLDATDDEKDKLLGGKYKAVVIDEAASFSIDLDELIVKTIGPALADHRGTLILSGTPSNIQTGVFFALTKDQNPMVPGCWQRDGWSCHRWSYEQNHYVREQVEEEIAALIAAKGEAVKETPGFKQMWRGQWCVDDTKLVYKFLAARNSFNGILPRYGIGQWHYVLGIDTGWKASAFTLVAYHDNDPCLYVLESWKRRGMLVSDISGIVKWYDGRFDIQERRVDGANKQAVEEMNQRHGVSLTAADKRDKFQFIDIMNDDFAMSRICVSTAKWNNDRAHEFMSLGKQGCEEYLTEFACGLLVAEYATLVIDERALIRLRKREEHPNSENHCADSTLYPWRATYPYLSSLAPGKPPRPGTPEHAAAQEAELESGFMEQMAKNRGEREGGESEMDWL